MKITEQHILEAKQLLEQRKAEYWIQQGVVTTLEKIFLRSTEDNKNATESISGSDISSGNSEPVGSDTNT